jgi:hypothetical protein
MLETTHAASTVRMDSLGVDAVSCGVIRNGTDDKANADVFCLDPPCVLGGVLAPAASVSGG